MVQARAAATERVRLGVLVAANTFRNPDLAAKSAVTLGSETIERLIGEVKPLDDGV